MRACACPRGYHANKTYGLHAASTTKPSGSAVPSSVRSQTISLKSAMLLQVFTSSRNTMKRPLFCSTRLWQNSLCCAHIHATICASSMPPWMLSVRMGALISAHIWRMRLDLPQPVSPMMMTGRRDSMRL